MSIPQYRGPRQGQQLLMLHADNNSENRPFDCYLEDFVFSSLHQDENMESWPPFDFITFGLCAKGGRATTRYDVGHNYKMFEIIGLQLTLDQMSDHNLSMSWYHKTATYFVFSSLHQDENMESWPPFDFITFGLCAKGGRATTRYDVGHKYKMFEIIA